MLLAPWACSCWMVGMPFSSLALVMVLWASSSSAPGCCQLQLQPQHRCRGAEQLVGQTTSGSISELFWVRMQICGAGLRQCSAHCAVLSCAWGEMLTPTFHSLFQIPFCRCQFMWQSECPPRGQVAFLREGSLWAGRSCLEVHNALMNQQVQCRRREPQSNDPHGLYTFPCASW